MRRPASVSGRFYPDSPGELKRQVRFLLDRVESPAGAPPVALISPHAGYAFSGYTAAHAYAALEGGTYSAVAVVSPSHTEYFDGVSVYSGDAYTTPLGEMPVAADLRAEMLRRSTLIRSSVDGHGGEHAIEVQLPFLQEVLGPVPLLPIVAGDQRREYMLELGRVLAEATFGRKVLLVASTDLSHYHSWTVARRLDALVATAMEAMDYERLLRLLATGEAEACGGGPAAAVMAAASTLGARKLRILHQCNSGDVSGDTTRVVGYLAAALYS
ncbi:MAG: AmmeMemoRadiSam system protein B [Bacteroidota bacterium]